MALDINTIKQASPKANQVATEQYVDTSIAGIDVTQDISANNDVFAQKLGYVDYQAMIAAASTGQTIINGGYVNTSLLQANSIVASKINTVGLIAENISANEISGKVITGGQIVGTNIVGVTIRASYLDLDGELEVLTNFYLCVGGNTTGVPALALSEGRYRTYSTADIDAVRSTSYSNLYRIPSISTIKYNAIIENVVNTHLYAYNVANVNRNTKAVKINPTVVLDFSQNKYSSDGSILYRATPYDNMAGGASPCSWEMYFGSTVVFKVYGYNKSATISGIGGTGTVSIGGTTSLSFTIGNAVFTVSIGEVYAYSYYAIQLIVRLNKELVDLSIPFTNGSITFNTTGNSDARVYHNIPSVSINNMI